MKSSRIAIALVSALVLSAGISGAAHAKGTGVSREPSRLFEGVPRNTVEKSGEQPAYPFRATRKGGGCTGLFEFMCN